MLSSAVRPREMPDPTRDGGVANAELVELGGAHGRGLAFDLGAAQPRGALPVAVATPHVPRLQTATVVLAPNGAPAAVDGDGSGASLPLATIVRASPVGGGGGGGGAQLPVAEAVPENTVSFFYSPFTFYLRILLTI